jgi:hypothetical protein
MIAYGLSDESPASVHGTVLAMNPENCRNLFRMNAVNLVPASVNP